MTSFVGRRRELARGKALLSSARQLTLIGPGGVGKTRLARKLGETLRRAFPDGVWLVELAELNDGELLAHAAMSALGLRDESTDPQERVIAHLRDKQLLLILDNCEHLVDACASLAGKLLAAAPDVRVVATSRHVLGVEGEQLLTVPPLDGDGAEHQRAGTDESARSREQDDIAAEALAAASLFAFIVDDPRAPEIAHDYLDLTERHHATLLGALARWLVGLNDWRRQETDAAVRHLRDAVRLFRRFEQPGLIATCFEALAWTADQVGDHTRAATLFGAARRVWEVSQMRLPQAMTQHVGAAVEGRVRAALGAEAFDRAVRTGAAWTLEQAAEYALGRTPPRQTAADESRTSDSLTARERDIARLVARGLTNKEIAAELVISRRTVDTHVEHILTKLGFRSRAQVAGWVSGADD